MTSRRPSDVASANASSGGVRIGARMDSHNKVDRSRSRNRVDSSCNRVDSSGSRRWDNPVQRRCSPVRMP